ncbi:terminal uridylyltransferase 7-like [Artemia franciscana]
MDGKRYGETSSDDTNQMIQSDDTVLHRLYEVSSTLTSKEDIKPHPYQSFDMSSVARKVYTLERVPGTASSLVENFMNGEQTEKDVLKNQEIRAPEATCSVALHKLYQADHSPVEKPTLKAHPYQYFDMSTVSKKAHGLESVFHFGQESAFKASEMEPVVTESVLKTEDAEANGVKTGYIEPLLKIALAEVSGEKSLVLTKNAEKAHNVEVTNRLLDKLKDGSKERRKKEERGTPLKEKIDKERTNSGKNDAKSDLIELLKEFKSEKIVVPPRLFRKNQLKKVKCLFCEMPIELRRDARKAIDAHVATRIHKDHKKKAIRNVTLAILPRLGLSEAHKLRLEDLINEVTESITPSLSQETGVPLFDVYQAFLNSKMSGQTLILVGSHAYGLPMANSDVNFMVKVDRTRSIFCQMNELKHLFSNCSFVESVKLESTGVLRIVDNYLSRKVTITVYDEAHEKMALVLKQYIHHLQENLPFAWKIVVAFRYWANVTGLDRKEDGLIPGYVFTIIAICVLQYLIAAPVIAEMASETDLLNWKPRDKLLNVGRLWHSFWMAIQSFPFRSCVVSVNHRILPKRIERSWGSKRLAVECPGDPKLNLCREIPCRIGYGELLNAFKTAICYFCVPQLKHGPLFQVLRMNDIPPQQEPRLPPEEKDETVSGNKKLHETGERENNELFSEQTHIDEETRQSISVDEDEDESTLVRLDDEEGIVSEEDEDVIVEATEVGHTDISRETKEEKLIHFHTDRFDKLIIRKKTESQGEVSDSDSGDDNKIAVGNINITDIPSMSIPEARQAANALTKSDLFYNFSRSALFDNRDPVKICTICKSMKHGPADCPVVRLPRVLPLTEITPEHQSILERVLLTQCQMLMPTKEDVMKRREAIKAIEIYIQARFPKAIIQPFGSCNNGFGFANSDLDLCFMLRDNPAGEGIDAVKIVYQLAGHLMRNPNFSSIHPIVTAKVPIVKGYYVPGDLEMDISVYNVLAVHNTRLLYTYAYIDQRVQYLGYLSKALAKVCDIGDASKGSLSSYAFIQMVLYYAQRCTPPLIPNLQEMYEGTAQPQRITEGWNTWFYEPTPMKPLQNVWRHLGMNRDPLAVHWINFLSFYAEKFDWSNFVVSIRSLEPLAKMDKGWTGKEMCIEDPFNLAHNLSGGLTVKMATFIKTVFIEAREHFGMPPKLIPANCSSWMHYYWSASYMLKRCQLPRERPSCFICGSLHHRKLDCPQKNQKRTRPEQKEKYSMTGRSLWKISEADKVSANQNSEARVVRNGLSPRNPEIGERPSHSSPARNVSSPGTSSEMNRREKDMSENFKERKLLHKTHVANVVKCDQKNVAKRILLNAEAARKQEENQQNSEILERSQKYREAIKDQYRKPNMSSNPEIKSQPSAELPVETVKKYYREPEMPANSRMKSQSRPHSLSEGNSVSNDRQRNGNPSRRRRRKKNAMELSSSES